MNTKSLKLYKEGYTMLNLQRLNQLNGKSREVVLHAENLGISFISGYRKDDYKSYILNFFSRSEHKSVNKTFWPLKNINFVGYQGEILGIIGSNGSGKTTLCKVISGILQPDEGCINVHGRVTALFSLGMGFNKELTGLIRQTTTVPNNR
jgi:teichoic acid transport system ATP-binding protein